MELINSQELTQHSFTGNPEAVRRAHMLTVRAYDPERDVNITPRTWYEQRYATQLYLLASAAVLDEMTIAVPGMESVRERLIAADTELKNELDARTEAVGARLRDLLTLTSNNAELTCGRSKSAGSVFYKTLDKTLERSNTNKANDTITDIFAYHVIERTEDKAAASQTAEEMRVLTNTPQQLADGTKAIAEMGKKHSRVGFGGLQGKLYFVVQDGQGREEVVTVEAQYLTPAQHDAYWDTRAGFEASRGYGQHYNRQLSDEEQLHAATLVSEIFTRQGVYMELVA